MTESLFSRKKLLILIIGLLLITLGFFYISNSFHNTSIYKQPSFWEFRSIDTMKYSRDVAREKLKDSSYDVIIDRQVRQIAETGATHVAIATPYDEEFIPFLKRWVDTARKYNLHVWFRGNWSGWQGWFDYPKIGREEHLAKTAEFILKHPELFEDDDVFSACPECENGGPGDPRMNGDAEGHKKFLIDEYNATTKAFKKIGKNVSTKYNSMNGDVARLIMDRETTEALGGIVVVDHYVETPERLANDIKEYAEHSGGKVVLGEFGAPIPDIHGKMTEEEQAAWIAKAFSLLSETDALVGLNYWTNVGGSTHLWDGDGNPRKAVEEIKKAYNPHYVTITVKNEIGQILKNVILTAGGRTIYSESGKFATVYFQDKFEAAISAQGYMTQNASITGESLTVVLKKEEESLFFKLQKFLNNIWQ